MQGRRERHRKLFTQTPAERPYRSFDRQNPAFDEAMELLASLPAGDPEHIHPFSAPMRQLCLDFGRAYHRDIRWLVEQLQNRGWWVRTCRLRTKGYGVFIDQRQWDEAQQAIEAYYQRLNEQRTTSSDDSP